MFSTKMKRGVFLAIPGAALLLGSGALAPVSAADPSWWRQDDTAVLTSDAPDNKAVANIGQAKYMAKCALTALRKVVPQVADAVEADLVGLGKPIPSWATPAVGSDLAKQQSAALLVGQLKAIAAPFYDHLHSFAPDWLDLKLQAANTYTSGSYYPWTTSTADDVNHGLATLGQLKAVFALDFASDLEVLPNDGIPDLWEYGVIHADTTGTWTIPNQITVVNAATIGLTSPAGPPPPTVNLHVAGQVNSRLAGKAASAALPMYVNYMTNGPLGVFTRNPNFWAADLAQEMTCMSPWNSNGSNWEGGTVITKRHIIFAGHLYAKIPNGTVLTFVPAAGGPPVTRTMVASDAVHFPPPDGTVATDLWIGVLDSDLPASITPCHVAPETFESYLPHSSLTDAGQGLPFMPVLGLNQFEEGLVFDTHNVGAFTGFGAVKPDGAKTPKWLEFTKDLIGGDSGNPVFLIVNDHLMLMTVWTHGGAGGDGQPVWRVMPQINATIAAVDAAAGITGGTGYTVTEMDLSEFLKF